MGEIGRKKMEWVHVERSFSWRDVCRTFDSVGDYGQVCCLSPSISISILPPALISNAVTELTPLPPVSGPFILLNKIRPIQSTKRYEEAVPKTLGEKVFTSTVPYQWDSTTSDQNSRLASNSRSTLVLD